MRDNIEKLLILQDRDRNIERVRSELAQVGPEREGLQAKSSGAQAALDAAKNRGKLIETERKSLELEVDSKQKQIERYANQQLQTRKNEEYRALAHEIETCKAEIRKIEDRELELMEQAEETQKRIVAALKASDGAKTLVIGEIAALDAREESLKSELTGLLSGRDELAAAVGEVELARYERLFKHKGGKVVVGVQHGVCGGCHMKLPPQLVISCQQQQAMVACPNCGRILYFTPDMDLAVAD